MENILHGNTVGSLTSTQHSVLIHNQNLVRKTRNLLSKLSNDPVTTESKDEAYKIVGKTSTLAVPNWGYVERLKSRARWRYSLYHEKSWTNIRCRLIASWGWSRSQGFGCSPIKAVRELGSERRETVRSLSAVGAGYLRGAVLSTRGPGRTNRWCSSCHANGTAG